MPKQNQNHPPSKPCAICGRAITWRKKWERDWHNVRYCSDNCRRSRRITDTDQQLEHAILNLLNEQRNHTASICPSEAARLVSAAIHETNKELPQNSNRKAEPWRELMEPARMAARRLVAEGKVVITQQGRPVDPSTAKGPIRVQLADAAILSPPTLSTLKPR